MALLLNTLHLIQQHRFEIAEVEEWPKESGLNSRLCDQPQLQECLLKGEIMSNL